MCRTSPFPLFLPPLAAILAAIRAAIIHAPRAAHIAATSGALAGRSGDGGSAAAAAAATAATAAQCAAWCAVEQYEAAAQQCLRAAAPQDCSAQTRRARRGRNACSIILFLHHLSEEESPRLRFPACLNCLGWDGSLNCLGALDETQLVNLVTLVATRRTSAVTTATSLFPLLAAPTVSRFSGET